MKLDFFTVLINISVLMLLAIPGFIFRKKKIFGEKDSKPFIIMLIYITQPFLIIMSFLDKQYTPDILGSMGIVFVFTLFIHIAMLIVAKLVFLKVKTEKEKKGVYTFASIFSNCGYIGIPIISSLFRNSDILPEMLIYVSVYIAVFNLANWTFGIYVISGNKKYISLKNAFLNPTTLALLIALPLFFAKVNLYDKFAELASAFKMLGEMTTPLAMTVIGIKLAEMKLREIFSSGHVYLSALLKLIIMPLIMFMVLIWFKDVINPIAVYVLIIISAMPTATVTVANTERFGGDSLTAAKVLLCTTILSVFTIPLICLLL